MRAHDARLLKLQAEEAKKTTIDDLTRGVVNYKALGLDFQRTKREGELRYVFSLHIQYACRNPLLSKTYSSNSHHLY